MNVCVCIIVIVIQTITCEKAISKLQRKLIAPKMNENCKKIKCPTVEDPQCVRMRRHDLSLTFHMIVANKCELEYLKCHDDVEGKIVPMMFCGQHAVLKVEQHKNEKGSAYSRPKRTAIYSKPSAKSKLPKADELQISKNQKNKDSKINRKRRRKSHLQGLKRMQRKYETRNHTQMLRGNETNNGHMQRKNQIQNGLARQSFGYSFSSAPEYSDSLDHDEKNIFEKGVAGHHYNVDEEQHSQLKPKSPPKDFKHIEDKKRARQSLPLFSEEAVNNYDGKASGEVDREQYVAACPAVCPSWDVMVCAKCQHGIYRTFSSDCHLRMYGCMHPKEKVQLISRVPCVQSSPFLSEPGLQPRGRIAGSAHDDVVLRYIRCRDKGLLETSEDPRCNFEPAKETLLYNINKDLFDKLHLHDEDERSS